MRVGDRSTVTRRFAPADMEGFARLAGIDVATIDHIPEPLVGGLFSYLLGTCLPGPGTNYLKQEMVFHASAPRDAELTATVEITGFRVEKHLCDLATSCRDPAGRLVASGRALVSVRDVAAPMEGPGKAGFRFVREQGDGMPVVLLHGWSAHSGFFSPQFALAAGGLRIIAPDLPGHGQDRRPEVGLTLTDLADALAAFLEARDLRGVVLVGWSMGATVALDYIGRFGTARLAGLAVVDMTPRVANGTDWACGLRSGLDVAAGERAARSMERDWPAYAGRIAAALYAPDLPADAALRAFARQAMSNNDPRPMAALWRAMVAADHRATAASLDLPVLVAAGGASLLYGRPVSDWWMETARRPRRADFAGAGHAPQLESPEAFNIALRDFAASLAG